MNQYSALLRSRARGDQIYRRDTPRPLPTDPNVIISMQITELLTKSREHEAQKRMTKAVRLTRRALELARKLPTSTETSLIDRIEKREIYLKRFLRRKDRDLLRSYTPLHSGALPA